MVATQAPVAAHFSASAISPDTFYVGAKGIYFLRGKDSQWNLLPGSEQFHVTSLAWANERLLVGTTFGLYEYDKGVFTKIYSVEKDFNGQFPIVLFPIEGKVIIGAYKDGEISASDSQSLSSGCGSSAPQPNRNSKAGLYIADVRNRTLRRTATQWFGESLHPNALFDLYASTSGKIVLLHGDGARSDMSTKEVDAEYLDLKEGFPPGKFPLTQYNPFLSEILRAGKDADAAEVAITKFLYKAPDYPPGIARQAWYAQFFLWARKGQWEKFGAEALSFPKSMWAARFLAKQDSPKARAAMRTVISKAGITDTVVNEIRKIPGEDITSVLKDVRDGKIHAYRPSWDSYESDEKHAERLRKLAAQALSDRSRFARKSP